MLQNANEFFGSDGGDYPASKNLASLSGDADRSDGANSKKHASLADFPICEGCLGAFKSLPINDVHEYRRSK